MLRVLLPCLLALTACVDPPFPRPDGGRDFTRCDSGMNDPWCDPASSDRYVFSQAAQVCHFLQACCDENIRLEVVTMVVGETTLAGLLSNEPSLLTDSDACRRAIAQSMLFDRRDTLRGLDSGRRRFNRDAAASCLHWLERGAAECAPGLVLRSGDHVPASCNDVYQAAIEPGGTCLIDGDCTTLSDGGATTCVSNQRQTDAGFVASVTGTCRSIPSMGEACSLPAGTCGAGLYCTRDAVCAARKEAGGTCAGAPCIEGTFCEPISSQCQPLRGELEPCTRDDMCSGKAKCSAKYFVCITLPDPDPLDVSFDYCLGSGGVAHARGLEGVPSDGGLP